MGIITLSEQNHLYLKEIIKGSIQALECQRNVNPKQLQALRDLNNEIQKS